MPSGSQVVRVASAGLLFFSIAALAQQSRITKRIDTSQRVILHGHVNPRAIAANDIGRVSPSKVIPYVTLQFAMTDAQKADLTNLLAAQQDPKSPEYHKWLTPTQYADRFGISQDDLNKVSSWLQNQGLTVVDTAQGRDWIAVSGTASQIEKTFGTELHNYSVNGTTHFANATDPSIPSALSGVVMSIRGLHDFKLKPAKVTAKYTKQTSGHHYIVPDDFAILYNVAPAYAAGINGSGQTLVVSGQTDVNMADIQTFQSQWNLPANLPQIVTVGGDPGVSEGDVGEADLDLEWALAVARNATIIYVNSNDVITSVQYAIDHALGTVISLSYGSCEPENSQSEALNLRAYAQRASAEGITWVNATGDNGAADCADAQNPGANVDLPSSIPEITGVGGTEFQEGSGQYWNAANTASGASALSYIPETSWNDTVLDSSPSASGGGVSMYFARPSWQSGPGVPADGSRHVPDVAFSASADHDAYLVYSEGSIGAYGGTSAPTPAFAGIIALLNQYLGAHGLGSVNPQLYALAQSNPAIFHDITSGDNSVSFQVCGRRSACSSYNVPGYNAGAGYDMVTGLGSVDAWKLMTCWSGTCSATTGTPAISGLTDAAAFQQAYSPGMLMAVFGSNLSPNTASASSVPLPLDLAGVSATVNGEPAPLLYVSSSQLNIQVPWDAPAGQATLVVNNNGATISQTFNVTAATPGIFTDGNRYVVPSGATAAGGAASIYITGSGQVSPTIATGAAPTTNTPLTSLPAPQNVSVTVGGVPATTTGCPYCFVGIPYGLVGVTQINFQLAANTPLGQQPVVVTIDGVASPAAYINVTQ